MTHEFALWYIPIRMKELGIVNYYVRYRCLNVSPAVTMTIEAWNEYYYAIDVPALFDIKSKAGQCNFQDSRLTELQFEHRGKITLTNLGKVNSILRFIQVIPKNNQP